MTQKSIKIFIDETYSKPPKKNYPTNKTDCYHIDNIWNLDVLDLKDHGTENNRGYRYVLVNIDNFSKFGWTVPLKNKKTQIIQDFFEKNPITSERKPNSLETDRGKEIYKNICENFLNNNKIIHYSVNSSFGAVFAERFNRTIRDLVKSSY